jgi:nucleotide-binding universal stress UspA family protein
MLSTVLVSLDGSELAERALPYAQQVVDKDGEIILLSVIDLPDFPIYTVYPIPIATPEPDYSTIVNDMLANARDYVDHLANNLRLSGYRVKTIVKCGEAATCIVEEASERSVDAIVMSTHGRSGFSKWLFGSVTQKVLSTMPCPVVVVPGGQMTQRKEEHNEVMEAK